MSDGLSGASKPMPADLREVAAELRALDALVQSLVSKQDRDTGNLSDAVADLEEAVRRLAGQDGDDSAVEPSAWGDYAQPQEWDELCDWVDWLIATYDLNGPLRISPCWPAHPGVAEELAAVWRAWREAARRQRRRDNDALSYWHDRVLAPCLLRLRAQYSIKACDEHTHEPVGRAPVTDRTMIDVRSAAAVDQDTLSPVR